MTWHHSALPTPGITLLVCESSNKGRVTFRSDQSSGQTICQTIPPVSFCLLAFTGPHHLIDRLSSICWGIARENRRC